MKVDRGLSPASVNQALAGMDHLFRFLGLGAAIVRREELPRSAPTALDADQKRDLLRAAEESTARDRAIVALLLFTGLRLSEAAALQSPTDADGRRDTESCPVSETTVCEIPASGSANRVAAASRASASDS